MKSFLSRLLPHSPHRLSWVALGLVVSLFAERALSQQLKADPAPATQGSGAVHASKKVDQKAALSLAKKANPSAAGVPPHIPNAYELGLAKPYEPSAAPVLEATQTAAPQAPSPRNAQLAYPAAAGADSPASAPGAITFSSATSVVPASTVSPITRAVLPTAQPNLSNPTPAPSKDPSMAIASQVQTGHFPCELGQSIDLKEVAGELGHYTLSLKGRVYAMVPMVSQTGAIMLEDVKNGLKWIQLSNKSMLLNSKLGQRMADECQSPSQIQEARNQKLHPPQHLLAPKGESQYTINVVN
jgi:hypothetical protein